VNGDIRYIAMQFSRLEAFLGAGLTDSGLYVLIWPLISLAIFAIIGIATVKDIRIARRDKRELV
jgi:4-hydroxybenzoate polyprenyltransferase